MCREDHVCKEKSAKKYEKCGKKYSCTPRKLQVAGLHFFALPA